MILALELQSTASCPCIVESSSLSCRCHVIVLILLGGPTWRNSWRRASIPFGGTETMRASTWRNRSLSRSRERRLNCIMEAVNRPWFYYGEHTAQWFDGSSRTHRLFSNNTTRLRRNITHSRRRTIKNIPFLLVSVGCFLDSFRSHRDAVHGARI